MALERTLPVSEPGHTLMCGDAAAQRALRGCNRKSGALWDVRADSVFRI
jgi:hypothetical protein